MRTPVDPAQLVALNALLEEGNVTRAARRLGLTQSSMSHRLALLRRSLGDPLFVRAGAALVPTPRALAMARPLGEALRSLAAAVAPLEPFVPGTSRAALAIAMPDLLAPLAPRLVSSLISEAPGIQIHLRHIAPDLSDALASEPPTMALVPTRFLSENMQTRTLGELCFGVVGRKGHPAFRRPLTTERWLAHAHIAVRIGNERTNVIEEELSRRGLVRQVGLEVPSFLAGLLVVAQSNFLMNVPRPIVDEAATALRLGLREAPIPLPRLRFALAWHPRYHHDPAHKWARERVFSAAQPMFSRAK